MKITPVMLTAGTDALARLKRGNKNPTDGTMVNVVFSAMHSAMLTEQRRLQGEAKPEPYKHQDWPAWRYPPDGSLGKIFSSPDDVPQGWMELPPGLMRPAKIVAIEPLREKRKYTRRIKEGAEA